MVVSQRLCFPTLIAVRLLTVILVQISIWHLCGDGKLHSSSSFFNCSAGAHPAEVSQAFTLGEGTGALSRQVIDAGGVTEVVATESPPSKEESSNYFWQTGAGAKSLGGPSKL